MEKQLQKGQVLLIVVLVMVVALTVGLSLATRSITNLRITSDDENSQRAFSAAEAGVERAVKGNCTNTSGCTISSDFSTDNTSKFETIATPIKGTEFLVKGGAQIKQDEGADVWLSDHSTDPALLYANPWTGNLKIYWGDSSGSCATAALQVMVLSGSKTSPTLTQYAYDPCDSRKQVNNFSAPHTNPSPVQIDSQQFTYDATIAIANGLLMRVIPLYTNTTMAISGSAPFSIQGQRIESTGRAGESGSAQTIRKVTFIQSFSSIPAEFFQYVLISP